MECEDQRVVFVEATTEKCLAEPGSCLVGAIHAVVIKYDVPNTNNILNNVAVHCTGTIAMVFTELQFSSQCSVFGDVIKTTMAIVWVWAYSL